MIRDLDDKELGQNLEDFSLLPLPCCLFFVASSLLPHLVRFLVRLVGCLRFHLAGSLIVGLAIDGAVSMAGKVAVGLSG